MRLKQVMAFYIYYYLFNLLNVRFMYVYPLSTVSITHVLKDTYLIWAS
jgi:hypothetical protein